jgi:hypothetical protein
VSDKLIEVMGLAFAEADGCGCWWQGGRVLCDDNRLEPDDRRGYPSVCTCRSGGGAALAALKAAGYRVVLQEAEEERDRLRAALKDALVSVLGQRDYKADRECATRIHAALGDKP